ncbi:MAG: class I SAM-dependent methyltransferase [Calditrichota bacterium]
MRERIKRLIRRWPIAESAARFLVDRRYRMARKYLRGIGMEIGALDRPLILPKSAKAYYLDRLPLAELRRHYAEHSHKQFFISLVGDGEKLDCIRDGALDFIVANHMIEHCQDPIGTLKTFLSKLRVGGRIFMAVPDMRQPSTVIVNPRRGIIYFVTTKTARKHPGTNIICNGPNSLITLIRRISSVALPNWNPWTTVFIFTAGRWTAFAIFLTAVAACCRCGWLAR